MYMLQRLLTPQTITSHALVYWQLANLTLDLALSIFQTIIETKEERIARGHPVGHDVPYAAMGGITGFSSLMDGYMRLDDSGIGPPPLHMLEQPVGKW